MNIVLLFWDQLFYPYQDLSYDLVSNNKDSIFKSIDKETDIILMTELMEEATYVKHHKQKLVFIFSSMRHFRNQLVQLGYKVDYVQLDDPLNTGSYTSELNRFIYRYNPDQIILTKPSEYRLKDMADQWEDMFNIPIIMLEDSRYLISNDDFAHWIKGTKQPRMQNFYINMRKKHSILIQDGKPIGSKWNYDHDNRKTPKNTNFNINFTPNPLDQITNDVIKIVNKYFSNHFGTLDSFCFAVTRKDAIKAFNQFISERLECFGEYQDAMISNEPLLYHSNISAYLNIGLLNPMECILEAQKAYHKGIAPINSVEGFIRQILGWREYIRGIYWHKMPEYKDENFLNAQRALPEFYWTGETDMECLKQCISSTERHAYAHHIQRLMVLANFCLLAGIRPKDVNEWFWIVYADAHEWVELPNVSGMSLFADGGYVGTKPYAASGQYINKMSDYCNSCYYNVNQKSGSKACPFNYLYWDFIGRNKDKISNNPRMTMIYYVYNKMTDEQKKNIAMQSQQFIDSIS